LEPISFALIAGAAAALGLVMLGIVRPALPKIDVITVATPAPPPPPKKATLAPTE
jgi:hypothetical protein